MRPIPRHTIPPDFPLSVPHEPFLRERADLFSTHQRHEAHSSQIFSCLSIKSQESENSVGVFHNGSERDDKEEDAWWEEAVNRLENLEKKTRDFEEEVSS